MRELCVEGVAIHDGPESCVGVREGEGEALTGVRAGWAIEPRNQGDWGADAVNQSGRPHRRQRYRELLTDPARSKNLCMHGISMRENREIPPSPVRDDHRAGRSGNAEAVSLR
jgi:RNA-directed DNA polymerase